MGRQKPGLARDPARRPRSTACETLVSDVEDEAHNTTRFVVLSKDPRWAPPGDGPVVTTFVFRVRNVPAALYKALGGFATNGVNMTKLESYMVEGEFSATQFLADVDGHPDDPPLEARARGARVLLARSAHSRRLSGASVPGGDAKRRVATRGFDVLLSAAPGSIPLI